jgi:hypothetical protein
MSRIMISTKKRIKNVKGTELVRGIRFNVRGTKKPGWTTIYEVLVEYKSNGNEVFRVRGSFENVMDEMRKSKMTRNGIGLLVEVAKETDAGQPVTI